MYTFFSILLALQLCAGHNVHIAFNRDSSPQNLYSMTFTTRQLYSLQKFCFFSLALSLFTQERAPNYFRPISYVRKSSCEAPQI